MKKKLKSKGDRLNWKLLSEVKPIILTEEILKGQVVEIKINKSKNLLVP